LIFRKIFRFSLPQAIIIENLVFCPSGENLKKLMILSVFGLAGVLARYYIGLLVGKYSTTFPLATLSINLVGSFLIGVIYVLGLEHTMIPADIRIGIMVGFLGGFTTFSAYCLESTQLLENGEWARAAAYFFLSPLLGVTATLSGLFLTRLLLRS
jgi:CrcB protein